MEWVQYDSVMKRKEPSTKEKIIITGKRIWNRLQKGKVDPEEPIDRTYLAFEAYLPDWKGFVTEGGTDMDPIQAVEQVEKVCASLTESKVMHGDRHPSIPELSEVIHLHKVILKKKKKKTCTHFYKDR